MSLNHHEMNRKCGLINTAFYEKSEKLLRRFITISDPIVFHATFFSIEFSFAASVPGSDSSVSIESHRSPCNRHARWSYAFLHLSSVTFVHSLSKKSINEFLLTYLELTLSSVLSF